MGARMFGPVAVSSADLHGESLSSGKGLYVFAESQTQCGYCLKGSRCSLSVDRCICAGYFFIST